MNTTPITALVEAAGTAEPGPASLDSAWQAIYAELTDREQAILGEVQLGKDVSKPFAYTHRGDGSGPNLCLELSGGRIELNLVGWKMDQAGAMKKWLMTRPAEKALESLPAHEVVVYLRKAHVKSADSKPFWQREEFDVLAACAASEYDALWLMKTTIEDHGDATAYAYHLRRSWDPAALGASADPLGELVAEVRRLLPLLAEINGIPLA